MHNSTKLKVATAAAATVAMTVTLAAPAYADQQPRPTDAVGVGSDTVQYVADFVNDGSPAGNAGYNAGNTARRVWSIDATADASGRAAYNRSSSTSLNPTVVLRAGTKPVVRPNGSGAGVTALLNDTAHRIDFVRSSRLPSAGEQATASSTTSGTGFGGIHVYRIAADGLDMAVSNSVTSNAPSGLSTADLVGIYKGTITTWNQVAGNSAGSTATIVPVLPQLGSGTRSDFLATLKAANGGVDITTFNPNLVTSEEHDPSAIATNPNAVGPFSTGRDKLIDSGYFGSTPAPNTINLLTGSPTDGTTPNGDPTYHLDRKLYILAREDDVNSTTPFQAGGSQNLVKSLFGTPTSWYARGTNSALFTAAGVTQSYADLGITNS